MAARAIWKARLRVGGERIGIKLYSAVQEQDIRFNLLHKRGLVRVRQRMAHPESGETVEPDDIRRGVEIERGVFVVLDDSELAALEPESSRDIEVSRFIPAHKLDPRFYERPYWLAPDEGQAAHYFALVEALRKTEREGVARWAMRKREYVGALRHEQGYLALIVLRHAQEVLGIEKLEAPAGRRIDERERKLGSQLVAALAGEFDPAEFHEEYRERVLDLVAAKRKGKHLELHRYRPHRVSDASLAEALEKSLRKAA